MSKGNEMVRVNIDLSFPSLPCSIISLDISDGVGSRSFNVGGNLLKRTLIDNKISDFKEQPENIFNQTIQDLDRKAGCNFVGNFEVLKVPGNFHISTHAHSDVVQRVASERKGFYLDFTHKINHLSFGDEAKNHEIQKHFQVGILNPLDKVEKKDNVLNNEFEYYLNIVPTEYTTIEGERFLSYQFTANNIVDSSPRNSPAIIFRLNLSPIIVKYTQEKPNMLNAIVSVCAIFGGMFTIAGILDSLILKLFRKSGKVE